ncbi:hypothetical protein HanRHA438_Chr16g0757221 [Helianthus annuus]|nr:hypothetical protein HanIR_Chr16g0810151 [Helianthus annuus]KAJ0835602.1 hypothetical protein HanRHA438_Chr16g0757221 [Helianthus annuus]
MYCMMYKFPSLCGYGVAVSSISPIFPPCGSIPRIKFASKHHFQISASASSGIGFLT